MLTCFHRLELPTESRCHNASVVGASPAGTWWWHTYPRKKPMTVLTFFFELAFEVDFWTILCTPKNLLNSASCDVFEDLPPATRLPKGADISCRAGSVSEWLSPHPGMCHRLSALSEWITFVWGSQDFCYYLLYCPTVWAQSHWHCSRNVSFLCSKDESMSWRWINDPYFYLILVYLNLERKVSCFPLVLCWFPRYCVTTALGPHIQSS